MPRHIAILSAMPEEIGLTLKFLSNVVESEYGDLKIFSGEWHEENSNKPSLFVSTSWSGWGKVSSARAATRILANTYKGSKVDTLFFTGVAGSANKDVNQWDIVIPSEVLQHDMDARPLFKQFVIPALNKEKLEASQNLGDWAFNIFDNALREGKLNIFGKLHNGLIATGDKFVSDKFFIKKLNDQLDGLMAVEMEGASVAQVAYQENVPWLIIRVISDSADEDAFDSFEEFIKKYNNESWNIIKTLLEGFKTMP